MKDCEILGYTTVIKPNLSKHNSLTIKTKGVIAVVLRLSDGEKFAIGNKAELTDGKYYEIKGFELSRLGLMSVDFGKAGLWYLDSIQKIPDISTRD